MSTKIMKTGRHAEGERNRQQALNYILKHPGALSPAICAATKSKPEVNSERLKRMTDDKDVSRVLVQHSYRNKAGALCNISCYAYTALRTKVSAAVEVGSENGIRATKASASPGYYKHKPDAEDHVRPTNQEGQGSGRRHVYVGGSMA